MRLQICGNVRRCDAEGHAVLLQEGVNLMARFDTHQSPHVTLGRFGDSSTSSCEEAGGFQTATQSRLSQAYPEQAAQSINIRRLTARLL